MPLRGTCNQCGSCCSFIDEKGVRWTCTNLDVLAPIGTPLATRCKVYEGRYDCMPIVITDETGTRAQPAECYKDSYMETLAILVHGMGNGCSLTWKDA